MSHNATDILASSPQWYARLPVSSLASLSEKDQCIHDQRPPLKTQSPIKPLTLNRKRYIDHYSKMAYHLRKNCDQSSTMETSNPENENIHPTRHIRRIAQHNRAFHLKLYQGHCRGFGKETTQEKQERDEHPITSNVSASQRSRRRCDTNKSGIRARRGRVKNENLELAFEVPSQYKFTSLDIDSDDLDFYPTEWLPNMYHADQVMVEREINNKETCQKWINDPYLARLHPVDKAIAAHIQLPASKYIRCKRALIMAACVFKKHGVEHIRRLDVRKQLHIDNSKIDAMYTLFDKFGWLRPHPSSF